MGKNNRRMDRQTIGQFSKMIIYEPDNERIRIEGFIDRIIFPLGLLIMGEIKFHRTYVNGKWVLRKRDNTLMDKK